MSQLNKLYRNFIILQEDERGYSNADDKTLSGYSKIEAKGDKCKISFYAQNLRKEADEYSMILISAKKDSKKLINLGRINTSDSGKAEITKEYHSDNIAGLGLAYDKISGAAIVRMKDSVPVFIMCGFINGEQPTDSWKNYTIIKANNDMTKSTIVNKDEKDKKKTRKEEKVKESKNTDIIEPDITEEESKETREDITEDVREEIKQEIKESIDEDEETRNKFDKYEEQIEKKSKEYSIRGSVGEYFEGIANGFEYCRNSYKEIKNCKWYRVAVNDLYEMCNMANYNKYTVAYYPMLNYYPYIRKYGHFMMGYKGDKEGNLKYIVYGIPGRKDRDEQPYEGKTGFVTWVSNNNRDDMGCWLMFYDFKNSTVVVPMQ